MDKETAIKVLEIMKNADGGCEFCVRKLFLEFIKEFPTYAYLARKAFREKFEKDLITEDLVNGIIKEVINLVLQEHNLSLDKLILFGSRARKEQRQDSDWDILLIVRESLDKQIKRILFKEITENLSYYLIPCDVIIKSYEEVEFSKDFYGTAAYEALNEGIAL